MLFFSPQKKHLGVPDSPYFSRSREKEHLVEFIGSVQLVWLPHLNCVIICFFKAWQKASDPSGTEMKKIICARAVRITTSEL